ncbi:carboxypeptidase regulatory-like domain-containing protein [Arthrobacter alkaliphilus]
MIAALFSPVAAIPATAATTASISGTVTVPAGQDVTKVMVRLSACDTTRTYCTSPSTSPAANGSYSFGSLPAGTYNVYFNGNNAVNVQPQRQSGSLTDGQATTANANLVLGAILTGRAIVPAGVDPSLIPANAISPREYRTTKLKADGTFQLIGLIPGQTQVSFNATGNVPTTYYPGAPSKATAQKVTVVAGQTAQLNDVTLPVGAYISGTVTPPQGVSWGYTYTGVSALYAGTLDQFNSGGIDEVSSSTAPDGTYTIGPLWPGDHILQFYGSGYVSPNYTNPIYFATQWSGGATSPGNATKVTVNAGQTVPGINASMALGGTVSGKIVPSSASLANNGNTVYTTVDVWDANGYKVAATGSPAGSPYSASGLGAGSYRVAFNRSSGYSADEAQFYQGLHESAGLASGTTVPVTAGQTTTLADAQLVQGGVFIGQVLDQNGAPLKGVQVDASAPDGSLVTRSTTTDANGLFNIAGLTTASYKLEVNADGNVPAVGVLYSGSTADSSKATTIAATVGSTINVGTLSYAPAAPAGIPGGSTPITPSRFVDTRPSGPVPGGGTVSVQVAGVNGIPIDAAAVVLNLTVTETHAAGFLTAYASGSEKPNASNVNYGPDQTVPNLAVVPVGPDGKITIANTSFGSAQVIADVSAYYGGGTAAAAGSFAPLAPTRFLDTRNTSGPVSSGGTVSFQVGGVKGIPANASAVVVNLTVTQPNSFGFLTAYASGSTKPVSSNVNYAGGQTVPNLAVVPVGPDGKVTIANTESGPGSSAQVIADVSGYFLPGTPATSGAFGPVTPTRALDTRASSGPVPAGGTVSFQAAGAHGVPANAAGVWVNLTVTETTSFGFLTGYASGTTKPGSSNVNYVTGQTVPNMAYLPIGADGKVTIANTESAPGSSAQIIADVSGYQLK